MQRRSTASCFATYLLPHVLFVADAEERARIARVCYLAWNIALFPEAREREHHVEGTVALILRDAEADPCPPPPGFRQGFADELRWLIEAKRELFPWQAANVMDARLEPGPRTGVDVLAVDADGTVERTELVLSPSIMGAHIVTRALVRMHQDTRAQRGTLEQAARRTPDLLKQAVTGDMLTAYCAQRADLRGYQRMLTEWREEVASEPELEAGIGRFLAALDEIEADTKAVLDILAAALDMPLQEPERWPRKAAGNHAASRRPPARARRGSSRRRSD